MRAEHFPVGCAFLLQPSNLQSGGWASLAGGAPFRFSSPSELQAHGPLWVTTMPASRFAEAGGEQFRHLRHGNFLPTPLLSLSLEVSHVGPEHVPTAAQRLSEILTRVVGMGDSMAPVSELLLSGSPASATLTNALQQLVAPALRAAPSEPWLLDAMPSLFKVPSALAAPGPNAILVRLPARRLQLAQAVLDMLVPAGEWRPVTAREAPNPLTWAAADFKAVVAQVSVSGPLPKVVAKGPVLRHLTKGQVRWMAMPEFVALSRLVAMKAEVAYVAEETVPVTASMRVPAPLYSPAAVASVSAGIFAEAYMHAACMPAFTFHGGLTAGADPAPSFSVRGAWVMSAAKSLMMQEALALADAGLPVTGYGPSHVTVAFSRRLAKTLRDALRASRWLTYPAGLRDKAAEPAVEPAGKLG